MINRALSLVLAVILMFAVGPITIDAFAEDIPTANFTIRAYNGFTDNMEYEEYKEKMEGVTFTLTGNDINGNPIGADSNGIILTTGSNGEAAFTGVPVSGQEGYILTQTPVAGYETMSPKTVTVTVEDNNAVAKIDDTLPTDGVFKISLTPITGTISFTAIAGPNRTLQGAEFELIGLVKKGDKDDGNESVFYETVTSDENGIVAFENIPYGNYFLKELDKGVNGIGTIAIYRTDLTISDDGTTFTGTVNSEGESTGIVNNLMRPVPFFMFYVVDQNGNDIKVKGIPFDVYRKGASGKDNKFNLFPSSDEAYEPYYVPIETATEATGEYEPCVLTTYEDGMVWASVPAGEYKMVERMDESNPIYHSISTTPAEITFKVSVRNYDGSTVAEDVKGFVSGTNNKYQNELNYGTIIVKNLDEKYVADKDGNLVDKTGEDGKALDGADFILVQDNRLVTHLQDNKDGTYTLPAAADNADSVTVDGITYEPESANAVGAAYFYNGMVLSGDYKIIQVKASDGYIAATTPVDVTISSDTTTKKITNAIISQPFKINHSVEVPKSGNAVNSAGTIESNTEKANGFSFTIERINAKSSSEFGYKRTAVTQKVGETYGVADFENIPYGVYNVTQSADNSNSKYAVNTGVIGTVEVSDNGISYTAAGENSATENANVTSHLNRGNITGSVVSNLQGAVGIKGATIGIYYTKADAKANINTVAETVVTDSNGKYSFADMPYNSQNSSDADANYYIKQISAPNGYSVSDTIITVTLNSANVQIDPIVVSAQNGENNATPTPAPNGGNNATPTPAPNGGNNTTPTSAPNVNTGDSTATQMPLIIAIMVISMLAAGICIFFIVKKKAAKTK